MGIITWQDEGGTHELEWLSATDAPPPRKIGLADDRTTADAAYRILSQGGALQWQGDYHNARQLLQALGRRVERSAGKGKPATRKSGGSANLTEIFHRERLARAQRARLLGQLLVPCEPGYRIALRRAPDVATACLEAYGPSPEQPFALSLRELLGVIGAHEWRQKGLEVAALGARIHPHYGVFAPIRSEYLDLLMQAPLPAVPTRLAFDLGTGTGVLAALLARRGVEGIVATDNSPRALACAQDNLQRLGLDGRVRLEAADLYPAGQAELVVCNPPWLPGRASSALDAAIYDPDSRMLRGFLDGLAAHLTPGGEGWLILSDLAEHLGLRSRQQLEDWIAAAGLRVIGRLEVAPRHPRAADASDPLHAARAAERTALWRLAPR
ncbi:class I SAM-dependent methyltransferase [Thauera sp. CAU 1555]|uniref:Class I SAM-dependent methyltransferase n=1 Tax=Thauera sedimentorum TaxID=2767595 RepID=A0ABR9B9U1_9RHOO|nr:class I SAM-dependent methyltransferase [Thauera sedimentorum]MBC9072166.1 class I SAM-dependent methyltransferase [Thauera sedimentorum]MBD8503085.1 class I SAM-dependent methyltransferase [Thauera sedimentorum]